MTHHHPPIQAEAGTKAPEPFAVNVIRHSPAITTRYGWKPGPAQVTTERFAIREMALERFNELLAEHHGDAMVLITATDWNALITAYGHACPEPFGPFDRRPPAQRMFDNAIRAGRTPLVIGSFAS